MQAASEPSSPASPARPSTATPRARDPCGHGLTGRECRPVAALPQVRELNIGHALMAEAIFDGLDAAIRAMLSAMEKGRAGSPHDRRHRLDLCDIRRIERSLERFGDRFTHRVFTEGERARSDRRAARAPSYARRFAAKEACSKALGTA